MHFELLLTGNVPNGKGNRHRQDRLALRLQVHSQMERLWDCKPLAGRSDLMSSGGHTAIIHKHGRTFVSPVRECLHTACRLDVVFYEPTGSLQVKSDVADPDNRLAGLLDLLSVPNETATEGLPDRTYVLLEDDKLLWGVSIERRRLLRNIEDHSTFTRIAVRIIPTAATLDNPALIDIPGH